VAWPTRRRWLPLPLPPLPLLRLRLLRLLLAAQPAAAAAAVAAAAAGAAAAAAALLHCCTAALLPLVRGAAGGPARGLREACAEPSACGGAGRRGLLCVLQARAGAGAEDKAKACRSARLLLLRRPAAAACARGGCPAPGAAGVG
jgi:hypothetical protein